MLTKRQRAKAIFNCLWFGILPSWVYEKECHYKYSQTYYKHLKYNLNLAKDLLLFNESPIYHSFYKIKWKKYFRWQYKDK